MKTCGAVFLLAILIVYLLFGVTSCYAKDNASVSLSIIPSVTATKEGLTEQTEGETIAIIPLVNDFITGLDSFLGGFVFYTPDMFQTPIHLRDGSELSGLVAFRDMFMKLSIPVLTLFIAFFAFLKMGEEDIYWTYSFTRRLIITAVLFVIIPTVFSLSIEANNLFIEKIQSNSEFGNFIISYYTKASQQIQNGASPMQFGIPNFQISIIGGAFVSIGQFIFQLFLFLTTFFFLLIAFLFILFQAVIRFASLLFLSVIYPLIIPFYLTEKTENIFFSYVKVWVTFLLHQPAFVLGYAVISAILQSFLDKQGASLGLLFFYTGFLFFLGGVNLLVTKLIGDTWTAASANMHAGSLRGAFTGSMGGSLREVKRGIFTGQATGVRSMIGAHIGQKTGMRNTIRTIAGQRPKAKPETKSQQDASTSGYDTHAAYAKKANANSNDTSPHSSHLAKKGVKVAFENKAQGIVTVTGDMYSVRKNNLETLYPTRADALADGVKETELSKVPLETARFIDVSAFSKDNPNPHNTYVAKIAKEKGLSPSYATLSPHSRDVKINRFLTLTQARNEPLGIKGVIMSQKSRKGNGQIQRVKLYRLKIKKQ